jgi:hypothetical protein
MSVFKSGVWVFLWLLLLAVIPMAHAVEPKPGLWEISATINIEGAAQPHGPYYRSQCLSPEDLRNPEKLLADNSMPECSYDNIKNQGNRFDFTVSCGGTIPMSGQGSINYTADKFEGNVDITADLEGLPIATSSKVSGARTGDCQ